jgi:tetratricopeptide (TPR) repeat protein
MRKATITLKRALKASLPGSRADTQQPLGHSAPSPGLFSRSPRTAGRFTPRRIIPLLALILALAACAKTLEERLAPDNWKLTADAESTYYYLLLEDAKRQQNATIGEFALDRLLRSEASPGIYIEAANFHWHQGEGDKTKQVLLQGLEKFPRDPDLELMLAQLYLAEKDLDAATATITSYLEKNPEDSLTRQELADMLIRNEQFQQALDVLQDLTEEQRSPVINFYLAKAHEGLGRRGLAIDLLTRAVSEDSGLFEAWAELAYLHELEQNYVEAEAIYFRMLEMGESSQELWLRLVDLNLKLKNPQKALQLTKQGPNDLSFALGAGTLFVDQGYYKQAQQIFLPLLESKPQAEEVYFYLALLAFKGDKDLPKAIELLEKVPVANRFHNRALRFRSHLLFEIGKKTEAVETARTGRELYPDQKDFWSLGASLHEEAGEAEKALQLLTEALLKWPDDDELLYLKGVLLDKLDHKAEAMRIMEDIVAQNPEHADALNYIGYTLADQNRELERAFALIQKALQIKPDNGYIRDSLAWILFRLGEIEAAWAEVQSALQLADNDPVIWEHYGDIAATLGYAAQARKGYTKALELGHKDKEAVRTKLETL